jgi:uncharacterized protein with HEPN domain
VSSERDKRYLAYIRDSIDLIEHRSAGIDYDAFERDVDVQDAIL